MLATRPSPATPLGARDRALLLIGFGAALRRSELAGLALSDVTSARTGPDISGGAADGEGPLFVGMSKAGRLTDKELSDKAVWRLVKGAAQEAGLEGWERFSGHSLRAGLATAAGEAGADLAQVMRQARHRSADVALGFLRPADLWRNNSTKGIWGEPERADKR